MLFKSVKNASIEIAPIFKEMGWTWRGGKSPPDEKEIMEELNRLWLRVDSGKSSHTSCGRLFAQKIRDTDETIIGLESDSYDEWCDSHGLTNRTCQV